MEAQCVHELFEKGTPVYIFHSEEYKAAEVQINLQDGVKSMGSVSEWWAFCQSHRPGAASAASTLKVMLIVTVIAIVIAVLRSRLE